jgi:flagellar biosynthetic protein FliQ
VSAAFAVDLIRRAVVLTLMVSAPLLVTAVLVGLIVTLLQAVTQLQEQTLTFLPTVVAMAVVLLLELPWMLRELVTFLVVAVRTFPTVGG